MKHHPNKIKMTRSYKDTVFAWLPKQMDDGSWLWMASYEATVYGMVYSDHQKKVVISKKRLT